jgi:hypothetical protein
MSSSPRRRAARCAAAITAITALSLAACGDDEDASPRDSTPPEDTVNTSTTPPPDPTEPTEPTSVATSAPATGDDALSAAIDDAAQRSDVTGDEVVVVTDERVTWRDGSLGCPKQGELYTQALVPGRRVILRAGGSELAYHAGRSGQLTFCARPADDATAPGGGDT